MPTYANINGVQREVTDWYANIGGSQRALSNIYANINGSQREIFKKIKAAPLSDFNVGDKFRFGWWAPESWVLTSKNSSSEFMVQFTEPYGMGRSDNFYNYMLYEYEGSKNDNLCTEVYNRVDSNYHQYIYQKSVLFPKIDLYSGINTTVYLNRYCFPPNEEESYLRQVEYKFLTRLAMDYGNGVSVGLYFYNLEWAHPNDNSEKYLLPVMYVNPNVVVDPY